MSGDWSNPVTVAEMYGDWDYDAAVAALDRSLSPRPSVAIFDVVAALGVGPGDVVLDIGGREGEHALLMAERFGCRAISVDPVPANNDRGRVLVAAHEFGRLVELRPGSIEQIPADDASVRLVFARDMLGHIEDLELALSECRRVLAPGGHMVVFEVFATPMLHPDEERRLCADTATVPERLSVANFEATVAATGFSVERLDVLGSEHVEASQEAGTAPNYLLQVSRLRRDRERLLDELGETTYRVMYGNALWSIYRLIGKLESRIYVLCGGERNAARRA
ncbi:MAG: class I SAM-dependent methyltransferase [Ilumatobacter sp.]|uniref:class I SAM-dependent methyltransferase n=1 Tax=Ilumatobacter sp. TaxID=1967498 RepID=UPI00260D8330|nr:class I SAM-dependent methyltransferase [Ilumatobacter sp.]MDJ0770339.1 class I SAM-dependent methyltransferase [Ilumatobacter sp.]